MITGSLPPTTTMVKLVLMQATTLRDAAAGDAAFLEDMLVEAANAPDGQRSKAETLAVPTVAAYVDGWPQATDLGVIAERDGRPVGAAWLRFFTAEAPAYGFVRADIPELAIGVRTEHRGRGIGALLLNTLADRAREHGIERISLSVEHTNPAAELYRTHGYRVVARREHADTMLLDLGLVASAESPREIA